MAFKSRLAACNDPGVVGEGRVSQAVEWGAPFPGFVLGAYSKNALNYSRADMEPLIDNQEGSV